MAHIAAVGSLILTPILWLLYHKIVSVRYYGSMGTSIIKELIVCCLLSMVIVSFGWYIIAALFGLLGPIIVIGALLLVVVLIIKGISSAVSKKKNADSSTPNVDMQAKDVPVQSAGDIVTDEAIPANPEPINDNAAIEYIKANYSKDDLIQAIKYYRAQTGADLNTAKSACEKIFEQ